MRAPLPLLLGALITVAPGGAAAQNAGFDSIARILRLPRTTTEARQKGVPDSQVGGIIDILRRSRVPAGDAQAILEDEVEATEAGQPKDNFGAFVQAQHRAGLRGRALADAIHAEQARRGKGHRGHGREADEDEPDHPDAPRTRARSDTARPSHGQGHGQGRKP